MRYDSLFYCQCEHVHAHAGQPMSALHLLGVEFGFGCCLSEVQKGWPLFGHVIEVIRLALVGLELLF